MRRAFLGSMLLLFGASVAVAHASDHVILTAGVVKAVDHATGVVMLDSGVKLRVRTVIIDDQLASVSAIRVDTPVFVSGVVVGTEGEARARASQ